MLWSSTGNSPDASPSCRRDYKANPLTQQVSPRTSLIPLPSFRIIRTLPIITRLHFECQIGPGTHAYKRHNKNCSFQVSRDDAKLFGLCDGYGRSGNKVAQFISEKLPEVLYQQATPKTIEGVKTALTAAYAQCVNLLKASDLDVTRSGCTCISVLKIAHTLLCANLGDSRAVVGRKTSGLWSVFQLAWEQPTVNSARIQMYRLKDAQARSGHIHKPAPGKSLSVATDIVSDPDFEVLTVSDNDKFVLVGTRCFWEVMDSIEAVRIAGELYEQSAEAVTGALLQEAQKRWQVRGMLEDDMTVGLAVIGSR